MRVLNPALINLGGEIGGALAGGLQDFQRRETLSQLGTDLGSNNYAAAGQKLIAAGDLEGGMKLLELARQRDADAQLGAALGGLGDMSSLYSSPGAPAAPSAPSGPGMPQAPLGSTAAPSAAPAAGGRTAPGKPMQLPGGSSGDLARKIVAAGREAGLSNGEIARMLATAQSESGMNPRAYGDANDGGAYGPFQFNYGKGRLGQMSGISPNDVDGQIRYVAQHWRQVGNPAVFHGMNNRVFPGALQRYSAMLGSGEGLPPAAAPAPTGGRVQMADASGRVPLPSGAMSPPARPANLGAPAPQPVAAPQQAPAQPQQQAAPGGQTQALMARLGNLAKVMAIPNLSPSARAVVQAQIQMTEQALQMARQDEARAEDRFYKERQINDPPAAVKEYEYARRNGFSGSFEDWKQIQRNQTTVNIDQKGETEFGKKSAEGIAKRFQEISDEGQAARTDMALLSQLNELSQSIDTGAGAAAQAALAGFGIKVGANVGKVEAYGAIIDKLTPQQRVPGSGTTSDFDMKLFKSALPSLIKTPEGNAIVMSTLAGLAQQKIARASIAERAQIGELDYRQAVKEMQSIPSPFEDFKKFQKGEFAPKASDGARQSGLKPPPQTELEQARQAISGGAPKAQVQKLMQERGFDPSGL